MGSAVDRTNIVRELQRCRDAGLGGVHIIPIYGAKGFEDKFIEYLSPQWMEMVSFTVEQAARLDLGVDMTTGSGWCFGGPRVTDQQANATVVAQTFELEPGESLSANHFPTGTLQTLMGSMLFAFSQDNNFIGLTKRFGSDALGWAPEQGRWRVYAIRQKPSGQKVKRAGPGGQGHMLNLFYPQAVEDYLRWFDEAFQYHGAKPRAMYHDSYEYRSDWSPDLFQQFEKRRGYHLQTELVALFADKFPVTNRDAAVFLDRVARVKSDYRETLSDVMIEQSLPLWAKWSRTHGFLTRNEAHGSPGNLLDLYATADIPETEMFYRDRNKLVCKFASSAAHVTGKKWVACETGTWLKEHFTETLADMKYLVDDLFLSGVNHIFYHGNCYSPDEAGWPGWHFYASYEMNPRNSIWRDVPALNQYVARCQSILQTGRPDNDVLLYWPIHDFWHKPTGMVQPCTVHARGWLEEQPVGNAAERLWNRGYAFDYLSDRQLLATRAVRDRIETAGGQYRVVVVPSCEHMPVETFDKLLELARAGATIVFEEHLPKDVPGWAELEKRRNQLKRLANRVEFIQGKDAGLKEAKVGRGRIIVGKLEPALQRAGVLREPITDTAGAFCIRRAVQGGRYYFIANRGEQVMDGWFGLATDGQSIALLDPMTGEAGLAALRQTKTGNVEVYLQLEPGASIILHTFANSPTKLPAWKYWKSRANPAEIAGAWRVKFVAGGPSLPPESERSKLASWTEFNEEAERFAGTARYSITFDAPAATGRGWFLDLGKVGQSARVRLNGREIGPLFTTPFRVWVNELKAHGNELEVEVTNVSANRIRDLDRRGVKWKTFYDINFVNLEYKPFDASNWPLYESGLMGPVTLASADELKPQ